MKKYLYLALALSITAAIAQDKEDRQSILNMCGCFEVTFNFAETFAPDADYEFHPNYRAGGLEYVVPVLDEKDKISLQHLLVVGDTMIIKHWRQDWIYENTDFHKFDKENRWVYRAEDAKDVDGQWSQKVYQVDDGPRYEGSGSWVHVDGRHYWEATGDSPLPRREFSKRDDYNVMVRRNRHEITEDGWIHEQDNKKVVRSNDSDSLIAEEKGLNTYKKVDAGRCQVAEDWWEENSFYWSEIRAVWDELFALKKDLSFQPKVDGQILFMRLFELGDQAVAKNYDRQTIHREAKAIIEEHITNDVRFAAR